MALTPPPTIDPAPTPAPQRGDRATFSNRVDAFVTWLTAAVAQFAAVATNVYANGQDVYTQGTAITTSASGSASAAATSATQAQQYAAGAAASAGAPVWVSGTTYQQYAAVFSPAALRAYRRVTAAGASTTDPSLDTTNWTPELPKELPYLHVQDRKASGTAAAALTVNTQNARELQTVVGTNTITGASLASNQITLPAGTYDVTGWCAINIGTRTQSNLYNVTDAAVLLLSNGGTPGGANSHQISGRFILAATKVISLRTWYGSGTATAGEACSSGLNEVYASLRFTKVA